MKSKIIILISFSIYFHFAKATTENFITLPCNLEQNLFYRINKKDCTASNCPISITHIEKKEADKKNEFNIQNINNEIVGYNFKIGKLGKNVFGLLETKSEIVEAEGLPYFSYSYFSCENKKLNLIWNGSNTIVTRVSDVILNDPRGTGYDEIIIKSGSLDTLGMTDISNAEIIWDFQTKKMKFKDPKKVVSKQNEDRIENKVKQKYFLDLFKGELLKTSELDLLKKYIKSCNETKSKVERKPNNNLIIHCYLPLGLLTPQLESDKKNLSSHCVLDQEIIEKETDYDESTDYEDSSEVKIPAHFLLNCNFVDKK